MSIEEREPVRVSARDMVSEPLDVVRLRLAQLPSDVPWEVGQAIRLLHDAIAQLADRVDQLDASKQHGAIEGVCRKCGCTNEHGCAPDPKTLRSCWWADHTKTLCSRCA